MSVLPTNRTTDNTPEEHAADHNEVHRLHNELDGHLGDTADAHDASAISFAPTGTVAATDVQAAIAEVAAEAAGGGAPADAGYLVTAAHNGLSAESVFGSVMEREGLLADRGTPGSFPEGAKYRNTDVDGGRVDIVRGGAWNLYAAGPNAAPANHAARHIPGGADSAMLFARKTADGAGVANSNTPVTDSWATVAILANEVWYLRYVLRVSGDAAGDFLVQVAGPTGVSGWMTGMGPEVAAANANALVRFGVRDLGASIGYGCIGAGSLVGVTLDVLVINGANGGNVVLQWAQVAAHATATFVHERSCVTAWRVA